MKENRVLLETCRACTSHVETITTQYGSYEVCETIHKDHVAIIPSPWPHKGMPSVDCPNNKTER